MDLCEEGEVYFDVCGIAGDYCVLETLKGLTGLVGTNYIYVLDEFTASIDGGEKLHTYIQENDINLITDSTLNLEEICISNQF
jgi:nicotinamidase-related amidase